MGRRHGAVEGVVTAASPWAGRSVFLTGHTGFKGGWLALWLQRMGAAVHGFALDPPTDPALFDVARIGGTLASDRRGDLDDLTLLTQSLAEARPSVVFHLAAQPLVRESYRDPVATFRANTQGTVHLLEAARLCDSVEAVVVITTDKVYRSEEWAWPYRESDFLGGNDPYSASKAAAEIVVESYRASFFGPARHPARVASARAGNVIGGGDWAAERLVPDCLRAADAGKPLVLRYPQAVRPWQHVLEPLSGYVALAEALLSEGGEAHARAWNFGPDAAGDATVGHVAGAVMARAGSATGIETPPRADALHETGLLRLDSSLARARLGWTPRWGLDTALDRTAQWHAAWRAGEDMQAFTLAQIAEYAGEAPAA